MTQSELERSLKQRMAEQLRQHEAKKTSSPLLSLMRQARASGADGASGGLDVMKDSKADVSTLVRIGEITTVTTTTTSTTDDEGSDRRDYTAKPSRLSGTGRKAVSAAKRGTSLSDAKKRTEADFLTAHVSEDDVGTKKSLRSRSLEPERKTVNDEHKRRSGITSDTELVSPARAAAQKKKKKRKTKATRDAAAAASSASTQRRLASSGDDAYGFSLLSVLQHRPTTAASAVGRSRARKLIKQAAARQNAQAARQARLERQANGQPLDGRGGMKVSASD